MTWAIVLTVLVQALRPLRRLYWRWWPAALFANVGLFIGAYCGDWFLDHGGAERWPFPVSPALVIGLMVAFFAGSWGLWSFGFFLRITRPPPRRPEPRQEDR